MQESPSIVTEVSQDMEVFHFVMWPKYVENPDSGDQ